MVTVLWPLAASAAPRLEPATFRAETLATGVYAIRPTAFGALGADANSLLVVGSRDALVVDAQFSASSTRSVIALVGMLTNKPVRWLVNTHWHDDHVSGNAEWVRANPGITIVGATAMRDDMLRDGAKNRASFLSSASGTARFLSDRIAKGRGLDDATADSTELEAFRSYVALIERAAAESASTRSTPPTRVFDGEMSIDLGGRRVRVVDVGAGHTRADVVVHVPSVRVIASGDLVMWPVPFVGSTSYPAQFGPTLDRMMAMPHRMIVPGHGPVQRDDAHVHAIRDMVVSLASQVDSMRRAGVPRDSVRAHMAGAGSLAPFRDRFAGADRTRRMLWDVYVLSSAIPKAYDDGVRADSVRAERVRADGQAVAPGCYRLSRPLGPTGGEAPVERDAAYASIMLRDRGGVVLPEVAARERTSWETRSEWTLRADSLTLLVFTGLQGWRASLRPAPGGWSGRAQYLSDAVGPPGTPPTFVAVEMRRVECPDAWRLIAPSPLRVSPSLAIYFAQQVDQEATLAPTSQLPDGAARDIRAGVRARYVMAQFVVDSAGRALPDRVKILKSDSDSLSTRVLARVSALRFTPAVVKGQPVAQLVQWQFVFPLR